MPDRKRLAGEIFQRVDELALPVVVDERELQAGRACVDDEDARVFQ
jgi:hypothetical protein